MVSVSLEGSVSFIPKEETTTSHHWKTNEITHTASECIPSLLCSLLIFCDKILSPFYIMIKNIKGEGSEF